MSVTSTLNDYGVLGILAKKLGITDESILKKASELSRLTEAKSMNQPLGLNVSAQNVISLDLAASMKGVTVDRGTAIKLSGMPKSKYLLQLYNVERLLDIQPETSVRDMCVRLGCMELCQIAERLLKRHKEDNPFAEKDHPMYAAGAILTVAKQHKISIDKQKLCGLGRTKPRNLESLHSLLTKTFNQMEGVKNSASRATKRSHALLELIADTNTASNGKETEKPNDTEEDFEEWKRRMLSEETPVLEK